MDFKNFPLSEVGQTIQLVGGIWADDSRAYAFHFPEFGNDFEPVAIEADLNDWKALLRQSDLVETEVLAQAQDKKLYKAVMRKCQRKIDQQVSWNVYRRDGYACRYCGRDNVPLTVDHLVLWEEGGPSIEDNLVASCKKCNKGRGNMQYAEWLQSNRYKAFSRNLNPDVHKANVALVETLDAIPRRVHRINR